MIRDTRLMFKRSLMSLKICQEIARLIINLNFTELTWGLKMPAITITLNLKKSIFRKEGSLNMMLLSPTKQRKPEKPNPTWVRLALPLKTLKLLMNSKILVLRKRTSSRMLLKLMKKIPIMKRNTLHSQKKSLKPNKSM